MTCWTRRNGRTTKRVQAGDPPVLLSTRLRNSVKENSFSASSTFLLKSWSESFIITCRHMSVRGLHHTHQKVCQQELDTLSRSAHFALLCKLCNALLCNSTNIGGAKNGRTSLPKRWYKISMHSSSSMVPPPSLSQIMNSTKLNNLVGSRPYSRRWVSNEYLFCSSCSRTQVGA